MPFSPIQYRIKIAYNKPNKISSKNKNSTVFHKDIPVNLFINITILYLAIFCSKIFCYSETSAQCDIGYLYFKVSSINIYRINSLEIHNMYIQKNSCAAQ